MSHDLERNKESLAKADHHREPWSQEEIDLLLEFWPAGIDPQEEAEVAEALGRTIEACRQRRYEVLWGKHVVRTKDTTTTTTTTRTTTTDHYIGHFDDPADRWWDTTK